MSDTNFASHTGIEWRGDVGMVQYGNDRNTVVLFYNKSEHSPAKSAQAGRPVYEDRVFVRIHPPGERLNIVDRPADNSHRQRYPLQWQQFMQQKEQIPEGTPIDMLFPEHPSIGATLRASGVHTVEMCAVLSANAIETIGMGAQSYVNAAVNYLKASEKGAKATELRREIEQVQQQNKILTRQVEQLKEQLEKVISDRVSGQVTAENLQEIIARAMGRPVHTPVGFDPNLAQLNATHGSAVVRQPSKRTRARV